MTANGLAGDPTRATADKGAQLIEVGAVAVANLIRDPDTFAPAKDLRGEGTAGVAFRRDE